MPQRPTIQDLARAAGVGTATVDRVLNGRSNVSARSRAAVAEAAERIGFVPANGALPNLSVRPVTLSFVLHKGSQDFYKGFAATIEKTCAAWPGGGVLPVIRFSPSQSPEDFTRTIRDAAKDSAAIAATAINHPSLLDLTRELMAKGTAVFPLLNDFGGQASAGYFGMDNRQVGRLAGWMMARGLRGPSRVAVFVGGGRWHGQALRDTGFREVLGREAPGLTLADTVVNLETRQLTYQATLDLLHRHPDLAGLYVAGGGMEGAIAALREARAPGAVSLIVNELTPDSRAALSDGYATMVVATPLDQLCQALIERMVTAARGKKATKTGPRIFDPQLYLPVSFEAGKRF
ncbi:LacI family DNA-binding transcriptional regulator [Loktanella sp. IMCC34160]|uniref:LacI family DNA-binding transcriptional regulator n=1 Tax=Loktanella sp. IMCC34160 TaxID=2510646 RepID=UPI00101BA1BC|nr:LacI family DNA-binding transcriptional regulator [Loktanella sp. IMCC34160]RYG90935.1 LacI family DNA-binding transcriptional regulator [Loktanella sp. IMCC34160]